MTHSECSGLTVKSVGRGLVVMVEAVVAGKRVSYCIECTSASDGADLIVR